MESLIELFTINSVAHSLLILSLVAAIGLTLGSLKIFGIQFGVAGVLFSGLFFAHFGLNMDVGILVFCRDFGLILFVYTIGMQVGPGFISSLRRDGLVLNVLAAFVVLIAVILTILISIFGHIPMPAAVGIFAGAATNTPSLGAAQNTLSQLPVTPDVFKLPALGYALAYPFGIIGTILTMILVRVFFKINVKEETSAHISQEEKSKAPISVRNIRIDNPNLDGVAITNIPNIENSGVVISRVMHKEKVRVALLDTRIYIGDIIYAVGPSDQLNDLEIIAGSSSDIDVRQVKSNIVAQRLIITKPDVVGKTIADINVWERYGITITRISRADIEFPASPDLQLHYADTLLAVGEEEDIKEFSEEVGNSSKHLDHPFVIPLFVGIALGIIAGIWPIHLPGVPTPVRLGLAGGPLLVAILLSRIGRIGHLIWYMPISANFMLRELGVVLFLACIGLKSGDEFVNVLFNGQGFYWMGCGALITIVPLILMAIFARTRLKMNYLTLCGVISGSMTGTPTLTFANSIAPSSNAQSVAYATVYPLAVLLKVIFAQLLITCFVH